MNENTMKILDLLIVWVGTSVLFIIILSFLNDKKKESNKKLGSDKPINRSDFSIPVDAANDNQSYEDWIFCNKMEQIDLQNEYFYLFNEHGVPLFERGFENLSDAYNAFLKEDFNIKVSIERYNHKSMKFTTSITISDILREESD